MVFGRTRTIEYQAQVGDLIHVPVANACVEMLVINDELWLWPARDYVWIAAWSSIYLHLADACEENKIAE